jgi:hypothetical protein
MLIKKLFLITLKKNVVAKLDEFIPGLSGMLYSFI